MLWNITGNAGSWLSSLMSADPFLISPVMAMSLYSYPLIVILFILACSSLASIIFPDPFSGICAWILALRSISPKASLSRIFPTSRFASSTSDDILRTVLSGSLFMSTS